MEGIGGFFTVIAIIVLYFLPTIIVSTKIHREKTMVVALNFFLGWTLICWFIALYMSLSREGIEQLQANQALTVEALKGSHETELKEVRRKHRAQLELVRSRASPRDDGLAQRQAEVDRLKTEYEERLAAMTEQRQNLQEQERQLSVAQDPEPETETAPVPEVQPAQPAQPAQPIQTEYQGEALYVVVPSQFERVVAETLERRLDNEDVQIADDASSRGIDIRTFQSGGDQSRPSAIVQCQLQSHDQAVEYRAVSDLLGSMSLHGADRAYLITTGSFSDDAQRMIESGTMKDRLFLIDGMTFNQWRTQSGLAPVHYLSLAS